GGFLGRLVLANGTLGGTLDVAPAGQAQRSDAHVSANNASFADAFSVRTGRADGIIILADDRTTIDVSVDARGIASGAVTLARLGTQRVAPGSACAARGNAVGSPRYPMAEPQPLGLGPWPARLCVEEQPHWPCRPQGPWSQPRRARACLQADRRRRRRNGQRQ